MSSGCNTAVTAVNVTETPEVPEAVAVNLTTVLGKKKLFVMRIKDLAGKLETTKLQAKIKSLPMQLVQVSERGTSHWRASFVSSRSFSLAFHDSCNLPISQLKKLPGQFSHSPRN